MQAEMTFQEMKFDMETVMKLAERGSFHSFEYTDDHANDPRLRDAQRNKPGEWIQTYTGKQFWPTDPHVDDIDLIDIAWALSNMCRYNGHTRKFYSVAEHAVYVSRFVSPENALAALHHDDSEAYIADLARPVKPFIPQYLKIEDKIMIEVAEKFGFEYPLNKEIKLIDYRILWNEKRDLMTDVGLPWTLPPEGPLDLEIAGWNPGRAFDEFMARHDEIVNPHG